MRLISELIETKAIRMILFTFIHDPDWHHTNVNYTYEYRKMYDSVLTLSCRGNTFSVTVWNTTIYQGVTIFKNDPNRVVFPNFHLESVTNSLITLLWKYMEKYENFKFRYRMQFNLTHNKTRFRRLIYALNPKKNIALKTSEKNKNNVQRTTLIESSLYTQRIVL